jgi:hypothetical protein
MRSFSIGLLIILAFGCADSVLDPPSSDQDIQEIVFRDLFLHNGSGFSQDYFARPDTVIRTYFVEFRAGTDSNHFPVGPRIDPDNAFIERFADVFPQVKKGSQCSNYNAGIGITDSVTNSPGLLFFVTSPANRISSTEVVLDGGWRYNANNSGVYTFRLRKERSRWTIYSSHLDWVS